MPQRRIQTEILIEAPASRVWSVLIDWPAYPEWNPWMVRIEGTLEVGAKLRVEARVGERKLGFAPTLVAVNREREFRWLGHLLVRGIFDGEHAFVLEAVDEDTTRFLHSETFNGIAVGLLLRLIGSSTQEGFEAMNRALKTRCESSLASARSSA